ncbi:hypothetical protein, partial [Paraburkholderia sp. RL17-373-BIF-A]|uniref:hypothetical protein n=1 Tax=Paraburkholderia sp. RL17-373-BIF-A TaxID=3031629 RepID=UPI0038B739C4
LVDRLMLGAVLRLTGNRVHLPSTFATPECCRSIISSIRAVLVEELSMLTPVEHLIRVHFVTACNLCQPNVHWKKRLLGDLALLVRCAPPILACAFSFGDSVALSIKQRVFWLAIAATDV